MEDEGDKISFQEEQEKFCEIIKKKKALKSPIKRIKIEWAHYLDNSPMLKMRSIADDSDMAQLDRITKQVQHPVPSLFHGLLGHGRRDEVQIFVPDLHSAQDGWSSIHVRQEAHSQGQADPVPLVDDGGPVAPPLDDLGEGFPEDRRGKVLEGGQEPDLEEDAEDPLAQEVSHVIWTSGHWNKNYSSFHKTRSRIQILKSTRNDKITGTSNSEETVLASPSTNQNNKNGIIQWDKPKQQPTINGHVSQKQDAGYETTEINEITNDFQSNLAKDLRIDPRRIKTNQVKYFLGKDINKQWCARLCEEPKNQESQDPSKCQNWLLRLLMHPTSTHNQRSRHLNGEKQESQKEHSGSELPKPEKVNKGSPTVSKCFRLRSEHSQLSKHRLSDIKNERPEKMKNVECNMEELMDETCMAHGGFDNEKWASEIRGWGVGKQNELYTIDVAVKKIINK